MYRWRVDCRTEDDRRCAAGGGPATARRLYPVRVRAVHLRADRAADLPGHAQAEVHPHPGGRRRRRVVPQSDAGRRGRTQERRARRPTAQLHRKSRYFSHFGSFGRRSLRQAKVSNAMVTITIRLRFDDRSTVIKVTVT